MTVISSGNIGTTNRNVKICVTSTECGRKNKMIKIITYGTYDLLHYGHIRLLERAKALGDYLIVGVTADDFDKRRGKINVQQSLSERIEAVRKTGIADEIIAEEYEGQKIDDIIKYNVDIFTVGSDWVGYFDYLKEYCEVVYLPRTEGVSSSEIREKKRAVNLGIVGESNYLLKVINESDFVNGLNVSGVCTGKPDLFEEEQKFITASFDELLERSDAMYIHAHPSKHYELAKKSILAGKHVLCESPIAMTKAQCEELFALADKKKIILTEALRTVYSTAYHRLLLMIKGGSIGDIISIDVVCTSLKDYAELERMELDSVWNSITAWGPTALLPIFQLLGTDYTYCELTARYIDSAQTFDIFTKASFGYDKAVASMKVGNGVKSEGELIISGTKGYAYVPAPWWKTDYFEIRYENPANNKRYFYQLDGEGIRNELAAFVKSIEKGRNDSAISRSVSLKIAELMEAFAEKRNVRVI